VLAQFSLPDERARNNKGILQVFSLPERNVEKGIAVANPDGHHSGRCRPSIVRLPGQGQVDLCQCLG